MTSAAVSQCPQQRAVQAEHEIAKLRTQIFNLKASAVAEACKVQEKQIRKENETLKNEAIKLKKRLVQAEINNGVKQVSSPSSGPHHVQRAALTINKLADNKQEQKGDADALLIDVSRLDMRIGQIVNVWEHPDANALSVEDVDFGEGETRRTVSGVVKHIPIELMQNRLAIFTCNLKPARIRGVLSEGVIMCASSPNITEIIDPPDGSAIGDRIACDGYPGTPDAQLNPEMMIFERIQPDLRISSEGVATYKGVPWRVVGRPGLCTVPTMRDSIIK